MTMKLAGRCYWTVFQSLVALRELQIFVWERVVIPFLCLIALVTVGMERCMFLMICQMAL